MMNFRTISTGILGLLMATTGFSQNTKEVKSTVTEVSLFTKNAQVTRSAKTKVDAGVSELRFTGISPFADGSGIRVKTSPDISVLSVNYKSIDAEKTPEMKAIERKIATNDSLMDVNNNALILLADGEKLIKTKSAHLAADKMYSAADIKALYDFQNQQLLAISEKQRVLNAQNDQLQTRITELHTQFEKLAAQFLSKTGEIVVRLETPKAGEAEFQLVYQTTNAGWQPSYDFKVADVLHEATLITKAKVYLSNGEEWKNVKLTLSSGNPSVSNVLPPLHVLVLEQSKSNRTTKRTIYGTVVDLAKRKPLFGVNVVAVESADRFINGTITDYEGKFSLEVPPGISQLKCKYIGFDETIIDLNNQSEYFVTMKSSSSKLEDVTVALRKINREKGMTMTVLNAPVESYSSLSLLNVAPEVEESTLQGEQVENQTLLEYTLPNPFSIKNDGEVYTFNLESRNIPADYRYQSVPKLERAVYLSAIIGNKSGLNLINNDLSVFLNDTYIGKSFTDINQISDTLMIPLGADRNVVVKREMVKTEVKSRLFSSTKETTMAWKITVQNKKSAAARITITDQVPLTRMGDMQITVDELSGGVVEPATGFVNWPLTLNPGETKTLILRFTARYPSTRNVVLD